LYATNDLPAGEQDKERVKSGKQKSENAGSKKDCWMASGIVTTQFWLSQECNKILGVMTANRTE